MSVAIKIIVLNKQISTCWHGWLQILCYLMPKIILLKQSVIAFTVDEAHIVILAFNPAFRFLTCDLVFLERRRSELLLFE